MLFLTNVLALFVRCLDFLHKWISYLCMQLGIIFMSLMTLAVLIQVVMRYIFSSPISWLEEFCIYSMFILTFLLAPYIILKKLHISMTLFYDKVKNNTLKSLLDIFLNIIAIWGVMIIMPSIFEVVHNSLNVTTIQMPLSKGQIYFIVPFSFILMMSIPAQQILQNILNLSRKDPK